jgi:hypothetical protein
MFETASDSGSGDQVIDQGLGLMPQQDQGQEPPNNQGQPQQPNEEEIRFNQAWNPLLSQLPQSLHNVVMPHLKQWDRNYNEGIQKVHSQYAGFKPFLEQQIAPEDINNAMLVYNALNENPQNLISQLIDYYKYEMQTPTGEQGQGQQLEAEEDEIPYDVTQHPEFQRMAKMVELLGQNTLQQHEAIQQQEADDLLEQEFSRAREQYGEFDEEWVTRHMWVQDQLGNDITIDDAVAAYNDHVQKILQTHRAPGLSAPVLMGGGGGTPSQQTNIGQLTDAQRKKLVAETLARANQQ